jgi:hypothetical protein
MTPLNPSTLTAPTHTAIAPDVDSPADPSPDLADLAVDADLAAAAADRRRLDWLSAHGREVRRQSKGDASWWVVEARPRRAGVTCGSGPTLRWAIDDAMRRTTGGGEARP